MDSVLKLFVANAQLQMVNGQLPSDLHFQNLSLRQQNGKASMAVHRLSDSDWQTLVFFMIELISKDHMRGIRGESVRQYKGGLVD